MSAPSRDQLAYALAVVLPVAAGLVCVWVHQDALQLGYQLSDEEARRHRLRDTIRQLEVELAAERSPERLMQAAAKLGLTRPSPQQIVGRGSQGPVLRRPSGRLEGRRGGGRG